MATLAFTGAPRLPPLPMDLTPKTSVCALFVWLPSQMPAWFMTTPKSLRIRCSAGACALTHTHTHTQTHTHTHTYSQIFLKCNPSNCVLGNTISSNKRHHHHLLRSIVYYQYYSLHLIVYPRYYCNFLYIYFHDRRKRKMQKMYTKNY